MNNYTHAVSSLGHCEIKLFYCLKCCHGTHLAAAIHTFKILQQDSEYAFIWWCDKIRIITFEFVIDQYRFRINDVNFG